MITGRPMKDEGLVDLKGWYLGEASEYLDMKKLLATVAEALRKTLEEDPPFMMISYDDDINLEVGIACLSDGIRFGPAWKFSLRPLLKSCLEWPEDDTSGLIVKLRELASELETELKKR